MKTKAILFALALMSCDRLLHRSAPDAGATTMTTSTTASSSTPDEDEEPSVVDAGVPCPYAIHPLYCRRRCKTFTERQFSMHARRMSNPVRAGTGTCDTFKVFAEDDAKGGIVEYYDETNQLVGVSDSRQKPCGTYGKVPTCKLDIQWAAPRDRK